jgi:phosphoribosylanthranilate isomerase
MTRIEDALFAANAGVDALGFIFYDKSPRYISFDRAKTIINKLPPFIDRVGVFVNASLTDLEQGVAVGLSCLQLHGNESPLYCQEVKNAFPACTIIKAFRVGDESCAADFTPYNGVVDAFLLDTFVKGAKGGTGEVFDWDIIERLQLQRPVLLAGGLDPDNVKRAMGATNVYALDVNSGVEVSPGVKDHEKITRLMSIVMSVKPGE